MTDNAMHMARPNQRTQYRVRILQKVYTCLDNSCCNVARYSSTSKERRAHYERTRRRNDENSSSSRPPQVQEKRQPKKKVALLYGYNGTGYQGLQINPAAKSITEDLYDALCKAGAVSLANSEHPRKTGWANAARTDKGVHAAGNVASFKMIINDDDLVSKINAHLPYQIRVWGFTPTVSSFNAKNACDSRRYEYLFPSYCLKPPTTPSIVPESPDALRVFGSERLYVAKSGPEELKAKDAYCLSNITYHQLQRALAMFEGTHNFHNYTIGRDFDEAGVKRFIKSITISDPFYANGVEWLSVKLHGQSFMLHQIRKMMAMAILVTRANAPLDVIKRSFEAPKLNIPKAPALGLLLEEPVYKFYNEKIADDPNRKPVTFETYKHEIDQFKQQWIYNKIFTQEQQEREFDQFFIRADASSADSCLDFLNVRDAPPSDTKVDKPV